MLFTRFEVGAALLAVGQAFLLPPTISSADKDIIKTLPFEDAVAIDGRLLQITCPGCPVTITDIEGKMHPTQVESALRLNFSLSHNDADQLLLNGLQIYPIDLHSESFMEPLVAPQLIKSPSGTWEYASTPKLGYSLRISHPVTRSNQDQLDLIIIHLEILEVADKFVDGIPIIEIKLLETPSRKLMIGDAEISSPKSHSPEPTDEEQECTTIICKWRAIIAGKLSKLKGCGGKKSRPNAPVSGVRPHGHGRPRPHGPHRPHRHHHRHGGFARFLRSVVLHVFIPVVVGIVVGVTASLVGMIVGNLVIFLWRVLFRRGQRAEYSRVQQEETTAEDEDSKSVIEHRDPPPVYEDAVINEKDSE